MSAAPKSRPSAIALEVIGAGKSFGAFRALDAVSLKLAPGSVHALLGENGAGKSTLVKGLIGYQPLDQGQILLDGREVDMPSPRAAQKLGIGMVYQHFTVAPGFTVAENLLLARGALPWRIPWKRVRGELGAFMGQAPFRLPLDAPVANLGAGEKQKLEILKQLYLRHRLLILDEPTSVLTVQEADEVLGLLRDMAHRGDITVLMITHKFGEVLAYADEVTVLRRGRLVAQSPVAAATHERMARWIMGETAEDAAPSAAGPTRATAATGARSIARVASSTVPRLQVSGLSVLDDRGLQRVHEVSLSVNGGELVGLAGISGNGQKELIEALTGQRESSAGSVRIDAHPYRATRAQMRRHKVFSLPEEPLFKACVGKLGVGDNIALRNFDRAPIRRAGMFVSYAAIREQARARIAAFNVRPPDPARPMSTLSGGNVQRAVLARELSEPLNVLIVANPVFGLDFKAVADVHARLVEARNAGAAVLVASDDLDELLQLADRLLVISGGRIVHEVTAAAADRAVIGGFMAAGH
ncbi:MAG: ABC transporter ATP-binding protein [Panacagrimonas sp.]